VEAQLREELKRKETNEAALIDQLSQLEAEYQTKQQTMLGDVESLKAQVRQEMLT
jgi:hypothetical protein